MGAYWLSNAANGEEVCPDTNSTWHDTVRSGAGERDVTSKEVIENAEEMNAEEMYWDEEGQQVYVMRGSGDRSAV